MTFDLSTMEGVPPPAKLPRLEASHSELESSQVVEDEEKKLLGLVNHHLSPPPLPDDWVSVPHVSGAVVYLHRPTRVVTFSRPYHVSTSSTIKKHPVLVHGIPCLEQWLFGKERTGLAEEWHQHAQGKMGPLKKIAPDRLKEYLALRWDSAALSQQQSLEEEISSAEGKSEIKRDGNGEGGGGGGGKGGRGQGKNRQQLSKKQQQSLVPEGLSRVVSVKIPSDYRTMVEHPEGKKPPAVWEVNMSNKNPIALLYEFCQIYFHTQPEFTIKECSHQHTPFQCTVTVGGIRYGSGGGTNKKMAKQSAASQTLDLFLPGAFSDKLPATSTSSNLATSQEGLEFLSLVPIEDPQAPPILAQAGFPSPWQTLKEAMQWNQGLLTSTLTSEIVPLSESVHSPPDHQFEYVLHCGGGGGGGEGWEVRVTCVGKKDGQTAAAQAMLKKLHPYITNWGALLKLYSHPPPADKAPPLPSSSGVESSGLLSHTDQQLLHQLRHEMRRMAEEQQIERSSEESQQTRDYHRKHINMTTEQ